MSLGSISHVQHYFARTGLLDGKGAQLSKKEGRGGGLDSNLNNGTNDGMRDLSSVQNGEELWSQGIIPAMLPPTVSTYKHRESALQPLPNLAILRKELHGRLYDARSVVRDLNCENFPHNSVSVEACTAEDVPSSPSQGWYQVQGMHILDVVTQAVGAAKNYYIFHTNTSSLYSIRSERTIRSELFQIMEILQKMASRDFAGGVRKAEQQGILSWTASIQDLLHCEQQQEQKEQALRNQWHWRHGHWSGREREREWLFLKSFDATPDTLPVWTDPANGSSPFLVSLRSGVRLIHLHNDMTKQSRRRFGQIEMFHTDIAKPYRCADNLRCWIKAAELRWEVKLVVNVMDVVQGDDPTIWKQFDAALLAWCRVVREELSGEWLNLDSRESLQQPQSRTADIGCVVLT